MKRELVITYLPVAEMFCANVLDPFCNCDTVSLELSSLKAATTDSFYAETPPGSTLSLVSFRLRKQR